MEAVFFLAAVAMWLQLVSSAVSTASGGLEKSTQPPPIPGLQFVGRGVNVITMEWGLGQVVENQFINSSEYVWVNNITNQAYLFPTQMIPLSLSVSDYSNSTETFSGMQDIQLTQEHTYHWSTGFLGLDSHSKTTYEYLQRYFVQDQSLATSKLDINFLELAAPNFPPLETTDLFRLSVDELPDTCCDAESFQLYQEFFTSYGHAFMDSAKLGGRVHGSTWYSKCFLKVESKHWVTEQSGWSFLNIIGSGHGSNSSNRVVTKNFTECANFNITFHGGDVTFDPDDWAVWATTIFDLPYPTSFTMQPIHTLVANQTKASLIEKAMLKDLEEAQAELNATMAQMAKNDPNKTPACCSQG